ncbi:MAG TPA: hypothetical protein ENN56_04450 [Firmicutes bacterium]|nr:hypothetical protein [Bacillota bacterium]
MSFTQSDRYVLRELAKRYVDVCARDVNAECRDLWRAHNSLIATRPLIYTRAFAWCEMPDAELTVEDPFFRGYEDWLRRQLFWASLNDDSVFEPWIPARAAVITPAGGVWGVSPTAIDSRTPRGAKKWIPPIATEDDFTKLIPPHHVIDEERTAERLARTIEVFGDILPVFADRAPEYRMWNGDISTQIAYLRGLDQIMLDMIDRPEWLHRLLTFMRDGIIRTHEQAEEVGDWSLINHQNQSMPYATELPDPAPSSTTPTGESVKRKHLWYYCASQETTGVGPTMFNEFMLEYQIPIMRPFGLVAYGCCEDLTHKIEAIRAIPNLRRIAVAPSANVAASAERIGTEYVISYRPNPAMIATGFDADYIRDSLRKDLSACRGLHVDITLKDVETVEGDPNRVSDWVRIAREVIDEVW